MWDILKLMLMCWDEFYLNIVKDPENIDISKKKELVPGLLGMNIIGQCYNDLFEEHGSALFSVLQVKQAEPG